MGFMNADEAEELCQVVGMKLMHKRMFMKNYTEAFGRVTGDMDAGDQPSLGAANQGKTTTHQALRDELELPAGKRFHYFASHRKQHRCEKSTLISTADSFIAFAASMATLWKCAHS